MWNVQNGQYHYTYIKVHIGRMTIKIKMRCVYVLHAEKSVYEEYILNLFNVGFFFPQNGGTNPVGHSTPPGGLCPFPDFDQTGNVSFAEVI